MFYDKQPKEQQENYKKMIATIGSLSNLFADSKNPALYYRAHENCFCKYFDAENLARHDCSADASKNRVGIGLKTWVGSNNQKVAEFGKLREQISDAKNDYEMVIKVAQFRNERIRTTMNMYGIDQMIYHVVIRTEGKMNIEECSFDSIDIDHIKLIPEKGRTNTIYFSDGNHTYNFNVSKTTLYMVFDNLIHLDEVDVNILDDPYEYLSNGISADAHIMEQKPKYRRLALKLFKEKKGKYIVEEKSGLNIWNAKGRPRHPDEVYIPFNKMDRDRPENMDFFPGRDTKFKLELPDGKVISAKVCQSDGKAIMSDPNKDLGHWLLRDVLELPEGTLITYELLQEKGFDTVLFEKIEEGYYRIYFTDSKAYDELYGEKKEDVE